MKVLFGMALRQTTGFAESLLRLIGLDRTVPDLGTLSRRRKTLATGIPYRGSKRPLHPPTDSTWLNPRREWSSTQSCTNSRPMPRALPWPVRSPVIRERPMNAT